MPFGDYVQSQVAPAVADAGVVAYSGAPVAGNLLYVRLAWISGAEKVPSGGGSWSKIGPTMINPTHSVTHWWTIATGGATSVQFDGAGSDADIALGEWASDGLTPVLYDARWANLTATIARMPIHPLEMTGVLMIAGVTSFSGSLGTTAPGFTEREGITNDFNLTLMDKVALPPHGGLYEAQTTNTMTNWLGTIAAFSNNIARAATPTHYRRLPHLRALMAA